MSAALQPTCAEVCPVEAIVFEDGLPEQWAAFLATNKAFFPSSEVRSRMVEDAAP